MPTLPVPTRVAAVSPHLDDAVFGCGQRLAASPGATVVTVYAGSPPAALPVPEWDRRCGFDSAAQAVQARRLEDHRALSLLQAQPRWLDFLDEQYAGRDAAPAPAALAQALHAVLAALRPDALLLPLGLFHRDHERVHAACLAVLSQLPGVRALAYEDVPYRAIAGLLQQRLLALAQAGWRATPARFADAADPAAAEAKARAVQAYASQLRGFGGVPEDLAVPERCWLLERAA